MIRPGTAGQEDAPGASRIGNAANDLLAEELDANIVRTRGEKENAAGRDQCCGEPCKLSIGA